MTNSQPAEAPITNYFTAVGVLLQEEMTKISDETGSSHEVQGSLLPFYVLLVLTTGEDTTLENVHDAWAADRVTTRPNHRDLVWFSQLPEGVSVWDEPFQLGIVRTARRLAAMRREHGPLFRDVLFAR